MIVETIEFFDDEDDELPPPLALKDIVAMNKAREYMQVRWKGQRRDRGGGRRKGEGGRHGASFLGAEGHCCDEQGTGIHAGEEEGGGHREQEAERRMGEGGGGERHAAPPLDAEGHCGCGHEQGGKGQGEQEGG